jgi:alpha/beta superfamily hydrolase
MVKEVVFNGPDGRIEGKYHHSEERNAPIALVLHPHPLHGGTMNNKVVYHTFHTFTENKFSVLRFNFRGVGKSHGTFDSGVGELADAACALDWLQQQNPEASSVWLAGFSFGSWIALQLLMRRPEINGFIAVSPPAQSYDFNFLSPCPAQGVIIHGAKDDIVPEEAAYSLYEKLEKQRNSDIEYYPISGADHFYKNRENELKAAIDSYIKPRVKLEPLPRKIKRDRRRRMTVNDNA